jgi:hypothetical protein
VAVVFAHKQYTERHKNKNNIQNNTKMLEKCVPCPVFAGYSLAFALKLKKKRGKTSVRVAYYPLIYSYVCQVVSSLYIYACKL